MRAQNGLWKLCTEFPMHILGVKKKKTWHLGTVHIAYTLNCVLTLLLVCMLISDSSSQVMSWREWFSTSTFQFKASIIMHGVKHLNLIWLSLGLKSYVNNWKVIRYKMERFVMVALLLNDFSPGLL